MCLRLDGEHRPAWKLEQSNRLSSEMQTPTTLHAEKSPCLTSFILEIQDSGRGGEEGQYQEAFISARIFFCIFSIASVKFSNRIGRGVAGRPALLPLSWKERLTLS